MLWEDLTPARGRRQRSLDYIWRLILISLHLKCDVFQLAPAFNLKDDRSPDMRWRTRTSNCKVVCKRCAIDGVNNVAHLKPGVQSYRLPTGRTH